MELIMQDFTILRKELVEQYQNEEFMVFLDSCFVKINNEEESVFRVGIRYFDSKNGRDGDCWFEELHEAEQRLKEFLYDYSKEV